MHILYIHQFHSSSPSSLFTKIHFPRHQCSDTTTELFKTSQEGHNSRISVVKLLTNLRKKVSKISKLSKLFKIVMKNPSTKKHKIQDKIQTSQYFRLTTGCCPPASGVTLKMHQSSSTFCKFPGGTVQGRETSD